MPLSEPTDRRDVHTRSVICQGYRRSDGLWDVEGRLTDIKAYPFPLARQNTLEPGDPLHAMAVRLTIDDDFAVRAVEAAIDRSPYETCPAIVPNIQRLIGLRIRPGWSRAVKERLGGIEGCTHLVELLGALATTAFQTIYPILAREAAEHGKATPKPEGRRSRPALIDTCHVFRADGPVAEASWPEFFTGTAGAFPPAAPAPWSGGSDD